MKWIPEPSLFPPEEKVVGYCHYCYGEIYGGETYGISEEGMIHLDCLDEKWNDLNEYEKAHLLGYEICEYEY